MNYYSTAPNISEFSSEQLESSDRLKIIRDVMEKFRNTRGDYEVEVIVVGDAELEWIKKHMQAQCPQANGPWTYAGVPIVHSHYASGFTPIPKRVIESGMIPKGRGPFSWWPELTVDKCPVECKTK